tara:strand:- start:323 stop:490 length:168 start_codon:yes stop_codon:yes gene_type:complete
MLIHIFKNKDVGYCGIIDIYSNSSQVINETDKTIINGLKILRIVFIVFLSYFLFT